MKSIHIGSIIAASRRNKGITQEELASYLGVSKPAVSKWESGQSYPDITLLPIIAGYFSLSVDDLLGYTPQMDREQIRAAYDRLSKDFAKEPFDTVMAECSELIRKYYSCWDLLFAMGSLFINHAPLAGSPASVSDVYARALALFERVEKQSSDTLLSRQSLCLQAYCHMAMGNANLAIDLLGDEVESPMSVETLLAKAYGMKGDSNKAIGLLQAYLYRCVTGIFGAMPDLMALYAKDEKKLEQSVRFIDALGDAVGIQTLHVWTYVPILITQAHLYALLGKHDQAISRLEKYAAVLSSADLFPLKIRGNDFFDNLDSLYSSYVTGAQPPRSEELVKQDLKKAILENPVFAPLQNDERFIRITKILQSI